MTVANLFARIGVKADTGQLSSFTKGLKTARMGLIGISAAATGFMVLVNKITKDSLAMSAGLKQFSAETGTSIVELQRWQSVADKSGASADAVANSIKSIALNQQKLKLGEGESLAYRMIGIDPRQDPFKIMEELRSKLQGLDAGMQRHLLSRMGVSADLLQTLQMSNDQFSAMASQSFIISPAAVETMDKARSALVDVGNAIKWLKSEITVALSPAIADIAKAFTEWVQINKNGIVRTMRSVFMIITKVTNTIVRGALMIDRIIRATIGWRLVLLSLVGVWAFLNRAILFSPMGAIIAGITAGLVLLFALLEDIYLYSQGKESALGLLFDKFPALEKMFSEIASAMNEWKVFEKVIQGISDAFALMTWNWDRFLNQPVSPFEDFLRDLAALPLVGLGKLGAGPAASSVKIASPEEQARNKAEYAARNGGQTNNLNMTVNGTANAEQTAEIAIDKYKKTLKTTSSNRRRDE